MKKIIFTSIFCGFFINSIFGQYVPERKINVTVTNKKSRAEQIQEQGAQRDKNFNETMARIEASRQAKLARKQAEEAARAEAMKDNYSKINIDDLIDNSDKYKYVLVEKVTAPDIDENSKIITNTLKGSNIYGFVSMVGSKRNWTHSELPQVMLKRPESVLYLSFQQYSQGEYTRISRVTLEDYEDKVIYQADHKNIDYATMLGPLLNKYVTPKEQKAAQKKLARDEAVKKLKEAKELLDLDILTQEEYDLLVKEYKALLFGDD